jgi:hypothetical protein
MSDTWFFFIFLIIVPFTVAMIYEVVANNNYQRGLREGYHRGRAVSRQEFWAE